MATNHKKPTLVIGYQCEIESDTNEGLEYSDLSNLIPKNEKQLFEDIAVGINNYLRHSRVKRTNSISASYAVRLIHKNERLEIWAGVWFRRLHHSKNHEILENRIDEIAKSYKENILDAFSHLDKIATIEKKTRNNKPAGIVRAIYIDPEQDDQQATTESDFAHHHVITDKKVFHIVAALRSNKTRIETIKLALVVNDAVHHLTIPPSTTKSFSDELDRKELFTICGLNTQKHTLELVTSTGKKYYAVYDAELEEELVNILANNCQLTVRYTTNGHYVNGIFLTQSLNINEILSVEENERAMLF